MPAYPNRSAAVGPFSAFKQATVRMLPRRAPASQPAALRWGFPTLPPISQPAPDVTLIRNPNPRAR